MTQTVLAIDDSPEIHQLLKVRLKNLDVELAHANCGFDGFEQAIASNPDLILLDVMMPDASGFDICRKLKATTETRNIPVIFLTGASDVDQKVLGFDVGAVDYIQKPFDSAELNARVRAALRTKRFQDMLAQRAMIDGLTGLWNRAHFDQRMHEEVAAAARYDRPMSLIMMDVARSQRDRESAVAQQSSAGTRHRKLWRRFIDALHEPVRPVLKVDDRVRRPSALCVERGRPKSCQHCPAEVTIADLKRLF